MLKAESIWLKNKLKKYAKNGDTLLNLGSSTFEFSSKIQPYIEKNIFRPLAIKGVKIIHADIKKNDNTLQVDFNTEQGLKILRSAKCNIILCLNVLEHIQDIKSFCDNLPFCLLPGGFLFISVPRYFPYHPDPIDNLFRPRVKDLKKLFPRMRLLVGGEIPCESLFEFESQHYSLIRKVLFLIRIALHIRICCLFNIPPSFQYFKKLLVTVAIFKK